MNDDLHGPGVFLPPPLVFIVLMAAGYGLSLFVPAPIAPAQRQLLVGLGLTAILLGLLVVGSAFRAFRQQRTALKPWKPTTSMIESGLFAWSRNPMYLAFGLISCGVGLALDNWWVLASCAPALLVVRQTAVLKEEAYLEARFGTRYRAYKARVRRWI
jgi:protein-S-isoprenylcysteine O-methyltransferase Ste14